MTKKKHPLKPSLPGSKAQRSHTSAMAIIEDEAKNRQELTNRLRSARLERDAQEKGAATAPAKSRAKKV